MHSPERPGTDAAHGQNRHTVSHTRRSGLSVQTADRGRARAQANVRTGGGEAMYDQRLFNQEGGLASGLEADDAYNTYDKPLFAERGTGLHRAPARAADEDADQEAGVRTEKFKPDRVRPLAYYPETNPKPEPGCRMQPRTAVISGVSAAGQCPWAVPRTCQRLHALRQGRARRRSERLACSWSPRAKTCLSEGE